MMIAHLLPNNVIPDAAQWVAVGLMTAGGLGILRRRRHTLDVLSWTTFAVGALACFGMVGVAMFTSPQPGYRISLAVGTHVTSPVSVTVCAQRQDGLATITPDGTNVLAVLIDGVQVGVESTHTFVVTVAPGPHDLRVELVTRDHRELSPVVAADASIRVSGLAAPASWRPCPNQ
jgi:hypothetical protein